jgi:pimeloyl-ACP methyl ester carboxylesterase
MGAADVSVSMSTVTEQTQAREAARILAAQDLPEDRIMLLALFAQLRCGRGFLNDLQPTPDITARIDQPTLVTATPTDGGVSFAHAQSLAGAIRHVQLVVSRAPSHFIWLGADWPAIVEQIQTFLDAEPSIVNGSSGPHV